MALRKVFEYSGTVEADGAQELDALDLSSADLLRVEFEVTGASGGTSPTLSVYLQCRFDDGAWMDRWASAQLTDADNADETRFAVIQKFGTFSDAEETSEPFGSSGASHLSAGTVLNGPFPRAYRAGTGWETAWRVYFDVGGTTPTWPLTIRVYADSAL